MQLPYFYEPTLKATDRFFTVNEDTSRHCVQVLRMKSDDKILLTDGKGLLAECTLANVDRKHTQVAVAQIQHMPMSDKKTGIAIGLLKNNNRFEWFLEKATELGVTDIYPLLTAHTEKSTLRKDRMTAILVAAMIQSQQAWLPVFHELQSFDTLIENCHYNQKLIAHCAEGDKSALATLPIQKESLILIGPEGDFSTEEIEQALHHNFTPISLGNTRLRTETAGVIAATLITLR